MPSRVQIMTNEYQEELKEHGTCEFPVLVSDKALFRFCTSSLQQHWHAGIELILIIEEAMVHRIDDRMFHPRAGQMLFDNSNTIHAGRMTDGHDYKCISITFYPRLLYGYQGSRVVDRYTDPPTEHTVLPVVCFGLPKEWHRRAVGLLEDTIRIDGQRYETYEMDIQMDPCRFWKLLYLHCRPDPESAHATVRKDQERIWQILSFIHENYQSDTTLDGISRHTYIYKSECCRIFRGYVKESLFKYLLKYRIEKSIPDVLEGKLTMTETALRAGLTNPNYFSKAFHKIRGYPPRAYQRTRSSIRSS